MGSSTDAYVSAPGEDRVMRTPPSESNDRLFTPAFIALTLSEPGVDAHVEALQAA